MTKGKIRLFLDAHLFDDPLQGSRTHLLGLYTELIRQDTIIEFYFGAFNIENLRKEFGDHSQIRYIKYITRNKYVRLIFDIPYIILKYRIDISHYQYITPLLKLSREIVTIHDVLFIDFPELFPIGYRVKNRFFFKRSARRADVLLTVSDYSRNRIAEHFKISEEDIIVIHNAVSADFFEPAGELPDVKIKFGLGNYILYVSRIEPRKNHIMLLKAFVELKLWEKNFQLVLIGGRAIPSVDFDDYLNSLSDKIRATVYLIDSSYGNELKSFYRNCRLFVFPSIAEGFGIPPLEAVASNTPMICSKSTAMGEFKFLNDRMFDPTSLDDLKEKITEYLGNTTGYSNNELDFIRLNYNWQDAAKHFYRILLESGLK